MNNYSPNQDFVGENNQKQGVNLDGSLKEQLDTKYTNQDNLQNQAWQDDRLYLTVSDEQKALLDRNNELFKSGHYEQKENLPNEGYPGLSGYFTDEATVSRRFEGEQGYDAVALGNDLQQLPFYNENLEKIAERKGEEYIPEYNPHLACFEIDRDKLEKEYGTREFMAALGKCEANNQLGSGGGNQGYNPYLNELYNKGCLVYNSDMTRTSTNTKCENYYEMRELAAKQAEYCAENHVEVPSKEISDKYGYPHSETPVLSEAGRSPQLHVDNENECLSVRKGELATENDKNSSMLEGASSGQLAEEGFLNESKGRMQDISKNGDEMTSKVSAIKGSSPNTDSWMGM